MRLILPLLLWPTLVSAESVIALRTIPAQSILSAQDVDVVDAAIPGAVSDAGTVVGLAARITIYAGHPIRSADFGSAATVERNQIVQIIYVAGSLQIVTEGRALGRGASGEMIRVMNLASRTTVSGLVTETGTVRVGNIAEGS
jgi:flagellar basal body P-ring formation protein FlgA